MSNRERIEGRQGYRRGAVGHGDGGGAHGAPDVDHGVDAGCGADDSNIVGADARAARVDRDLSHLRPRGVHDQRERRY